MASMVGLLGCLAREKGLSGVLFLQHFGAMVVGGIVLGLLSPLYVV